MSRAGGAVLSQDHLRLPHARGMLGSSGRSVVEGACILNFDLAPQEALRGLGERAFFGSSSGPLEQSPDPGRTAANHRRQPPQWQPPSRPRPGPAPGAVAGCSGLAGARSRLRWHSGVIRPEIATQRRPSPAASPLLGVDRTSISGGWRSVYSQRTKPLSR